MRVTLLQEVKLIATSVVADIDVPLTSHRLCVVDVRTREKFLIDTGADISVLAAKKSDRARATTSYQLFAANNTPIRTYGERTLELNLGLRRSFRWTFVIADVKTSILGADFLTKHKLLVDLHHRKLIDSVTELKINAIKIKNSDPAVYTLNKDHPYHDILSKYPDVLRPMSLKNPAKHNVTHHIETTGPPIFSRPRPLPPDKYKAAKEEFEKMINMGICQPSNKNTFVYKELTTCSHVFIRNDTVRSPLTPPYDGPYQVIERNSKTFKIQLPLRTTVISVDRLKPAHLYNEESDASTPPQNAPACPAATSSIVPRSNEVVPPSTQPYVTRSGRQVKPSVRFA